jgi:hypothetical protein
VKVPAEGFVRILLPADAEPHAAARQRVECAPLLRDERRPPGETSTSVPSPMREVSPATCASVISVISAFKDGLVGW